VSRTGKEQPQSRRRGQKNKEKLIAETNQEAITEYDECNDIDMAILLINMKPLLDN